MNKKLYLLFALALTATFALNGCKNKPQQRETATEKIDDQPAVQDSTIYGVCGEGTMMHTLELITDAGDTLTFALPDTEDGTDPVVGGLLAGDRLAVVKGQPVDGRRRLQRSSTSRRCRVSGQALTRTLRFLKEVRSSRMWKQRRILGHPGRSSTVSCCSTATLSILITLAATLSR